MRNFSWKRFCSTELFSCEHNPLYSNVPFVYPLKTSENQSFPNVFRGHTNGKLVENVLTKRFRTSFPKNTSKCLFLKKKNLTVKEEKSHCMKRQSHSNPLQILLPILRNEFKGLINFYSPWNYQKFLNFLMISGGIEVNLLRFLILEVKFGDGPLSTE